MTSTANIDQARADALDAFLTTQNAAAAKGATAPMFTENSRPLAVDVIPTGATELDIALGVGGLPRGRIVEIYGPEGSGKTSLALSVSGQAIKAGGTAGFVDAEHAINFEHARWLGVDTNYFVVNQPDFGEQALQQAEAMCKSGLFSVVTVDSVASLVPKAELDGDIGDQFMGLQARMMSQALRRLQTVASNTGTTLIFINQLREKIGVMFGSPETQPGGKALKFFSSVRLDVRAPAGEQIKSGTGNSQTIIGQRCKIKVVKNKVAPPFRKAEYNLMYGQGIDEADGLISGALHLGIWTMKPGGTYLNTATEEVIGRGRDNIITELQTNDTLRESLRQQVTDTLLAARSFPTTDEAGDNAMPAVDIDAVAS